MIALIFIRILCLQLKVLIATLYYLYVTEVSFYNGNISGATKLFGTTVQRRHNHGGGRVFSKIYQGRWEAYFDTSYKGKGCFAK
jgi:hypothetical protein